MLSGKNAVLRTLRKDDISTVHDLSVRMEEMGDYWPADFTSEIRFQNHFDETGCWEEHSGTLLITDHADRLLGQIFYFKGIPYGSGYEIGYRVFKQEDMGKGYATEALQMLVDYLFSRKPAERLQATTITGNAASQRVLEKAGFRPEGVLRKAVFHRGSNMDIQMNCILREEWEALKAD